MILPFKEEIVNDKEYSEYNFLHPNFIGYLNKYGDPIEYINPLGWGGHNNNRVTALFEHYFHMPKNDLWMQEDKGINVIDREYEKFNAREKYKRIKLQVDLIKEYGGSKTPEGKFLDDLFMFFYNCYQAETFMDGFGQNCMCLNEREFLEKYCNGKEHYQKQETETEEQYKDRYKQFFEYDYHWYKKSLMLDWYKVVIVQYMHYHLVERCQKGITTSDTRVNETFYNYKIQGFKIHQVPRMIFDSEKKTYIPYVQNEFLIPDSEFILEQEIQSIERRVCPKERVKFYRSDKF